MSGYSYTVIHSFNCDSKLSTYFFALTNSKSQYNGQNCDPLTFRWNNQKACVREKVSKQIFKKKTFHGHFIQNYHDFFF